jgi:hypothetical protein
MVYKFKLLFYVSLSSFGSILNLAFCCYYIKFDMPNSVNGVSVAFYDGETSYSMSMIFILWFFIFFLISYSIIEFSVIMFKLVKFFNMVIILICSWTLWVPIFYIFDNFSILTGLLTHGNMLYTNSIMLSFKCIRMNLWFIKPFLKFNPINSVIWICFSNWSPFSFVFGGFSKESSEVLVKNSLEMILRK